ncbi:MAG: cyclic nucleotide-binding and patatin-like phospholipase domain-containing protein [Ilumatobacteraceae bacterium]
MHDHRRRPAADASATPWAAADEWVLHAGDVLLREGDDGDDVFEVVTGSLEVLRGPELARVDVVGPGATVGEIAALAGRPRAATVRALERSEVRRVDGDTYRRWLAADEQALSTLTLLARARVDRHRAITMVSDLLGVDPAEASEIVDVGEFVHVDAGDVLFAEGEPSEAAYLVIRGRLQASTQAIHVGEVGRGEVVGEVGVLQQTARSATLTALRDSTLSRFDRDAFGALTTKHPRLMIHLARTILARAGRPASTSDRARSISVTVTAPLDVGRIMTTIASELARHGSTRRLDAAGVDATLGRPGVVESDLSVAWPAVAELLEDAEATNDYLLLETEPDDGRWTRRALTQADRIVIVTSAHPDAGERRALGALLAAVPGRTGAERWLAVVHRPGDERPAGGAALADRVGVDRVVHLRRGSDADLRRLARLVSGNATGLVLGGGGARGFAHLGVWRALCELGIEVDTIGGASIGAPLGAVMALQVAPDELEAMTTELFRGLLDYTVPIVSLVKGRRITRNIGKVFDGVDVRDLWLPYFCVSTNITRARLEVHDRADLATAIRASVALPGILPPVALDGDLLVDGGVLNNLPCDVMRATGTVGRLIAVDLSRTGPTTVGEDVDIGRSASGWRALRRRAFAGRGPFPGAVSTVMRSVVAGSVRDRDRMLADGIVDWYLDLDMQGVHLLDFERVSEIAGRGYVAARPRLEAWLQATP